VINVAGLFGSELEILFGDEFFQRFDLELDFLLELTERMDLLHSFAEELVFLPDDHAEPFELMGD
jgi:hypothetical protein